MLRRYEGQLDGKIVVDITKPRRHRDLIAARVRAAKVVKAFNTTFAGMLVEGQVAGEQVDLLLASDDDDAKHMGSRLAADGGMRPIDAGPLAPAHHLEALGYLNMAIQPTLGTKYGSAFKVLA